MFSSFLSGKTSFSTTCSDRHVTFAYLRFELALEWDCAENFICASLAHLKSASGVC